MRLINFLKQSTRFIPKNNKFSIAMQPNIKTDIVQCLPDITDSFEVVNNLLSNNNISIYVGLLKNRPCIVRHLFKASGELLRDEDFAEYLFKNLDHLDNNLINESILNSDVFSELYMNKMLYEDDLYFDKLNTKSLTKMLNMKYFNVENFTKLLVVKKEKIIFIIENSNVEIIKEWELFVLNNYNTLVRNKCEYLIDLLMIESRNFKNMLFNIIIN
jgi:hypothetical protein